MSYGENPLSPEPEIPAPVNEERAAEFAGPVIQPGENPEWGIWEAVRIAVVAMIAIGLLSTVALGLALRYAGPARPAPADLARNARVVVPAQFAAYLVVIAYMVWVVRSRGRRFWAAIRWKWPQATWFRGRRAPHLRQFF